MLHDGLADFARAFCSVFCLLVALLCFQVIWALDGLMRVLLARLIAEIERSECQAGGFEALNARAVRKNFSDRLPVVRGFFQNLLVLWLVVLARQPGKLALRADSV